MPPRNVVLMLVTALGIAAPGCGPDRRAWEAELGAAGASRLAGAWTIRLEGDHPVRGSMAFTLNSERLGGLGSGTPPMLFGTYDIDFHGLGSAAGSGTAVPEASAAIRGDSVAITLAPGSSLPMELIGVLRGDSVVGRWRVVPRSGGREGAFRMTRQGIRPIPD